MILQLLQEGDPFLLESTPEFLFDGQIDPELLSQDLVETMNHHGAFGLAANQCGLDMRVFVLAPLPDDDNPIICFNPQIISVSENEANDLEGCLSFPDLVLSIPRSILVNVQYQNEKGEIIETVFTNLHARGFLHELDHLNGIVFTSHVSKLKLDMAKKKRSKR